MRAVLNLIGGFLSRRAVVFYSEKSGPIVPFKKHLDAAISGLLEKLDILIGAQGLENSSDAVCLFDNLFGCKTLAPLEIPVKLGPDLLEARMLRSNLLRDQQAAAFDQTLVNSGEQASPLCHRQKLHGEQRRNEIGRGAEVDPGDVFLEKANIGSTHLLARFFDHELAQVEAEELDILLTRMTIREKLKRRARRTTQVVHHTMVPDKIFTKLNDHALHLDIKGHALLYMGVKRLGDIFVEPPFTRYGSNRIVYGPTSAELQAA